MGAWRAILMVALAAGLGACTAARPTSVAQTPALAAELRAAEVYTPGPRTRSLRTLVTTGAGDRRVREERVYAAPDDTGHWTAATRERGEETDDWAGVQTLELSFAPDGSAVLHGIANEESGKRVRLSRRARDGGGVAGVVMMPAVLRMGEVHEDVCAARTTALDGKSSDALTGSARVRTWITMEQAATHGPSELVLHVDLTISAGPAIVQRRTSVRYQAGEGRWMLAGELATLRVLVGPVAIEETSRDAEVVGEERKLEGGPPVPGGWKAL